MLSDSNINTSDPIALRYLMSETIFALDVEEKTVQARDEIPTVQPKESNKVRTEFVFYGENKSNYLFLTHEKQSQFMSEVALDAFTKTLTALKLTVSDVAVLNLATLPAVPQKEEIISFFKPKTMVFLGVPPETVRLDVTASQPIAQYESVTIFHTFTFDEMLADGEKKRIFWTTIKTLLT